METRRVWVEGRWREISGTAARSGGLAAGGRAGVDSRLRVHYFGAARVVVSKRPLRKSYNQRMIELGVEPRRKSVVIAEDEPAHYLILGDFGGRATEPLAIDRDNFDAVMEKLQVSLAGAAFRELDDFHPDNLYRKLNLFREFDAAPRAERAETEVPKADIGELLRPSSLLEQITEGGDPMERYLRELARADAAAPDAVRSATRRGSGQAHAGAAASSALPGSGSFVARARLCDPGRCGRLGAFSHRTFYERRSRAGFAGG